MSGNFKYTRLKREKEVEKKGKKRHVAAGGLAYKWVSPGQAGVPDQIFLNPIPPEHREIVAKYLRFVEYKRPGNKKGLSAIQEEVHADIRALGFTVLVLDADEGIFDEF